MRGMGHNVAARDGALPTRHPTGTWDLVNPIATSMLTLFASALNRPAVIGMLHAPPLPGSPDNELTMSEIVTFVLRDAEALSLAVTEALRTGSDASLDGYALERRKAAAKVLEMTDRLTKVATLANPVSRWFRNRLIATAAALPRVRLFAARTLAGFN